MILAPADGFDAIEFRTPEGKTLRVEVDLFVLYNQLVELAAEGMPDSEFFTRQAAHLAGLVAAAHPSEPPLNISALAAASVYRQVQTAVTELKKKDPSWTSAGSLGSTVSPFGPTSAAE